MSAIGVRTLDGAEAALDSVAVDELRTLVGSQLITPDDPGYDRARRVWNGMIDKRPALIVCCRGEADVMASVRFARSHELSLAVRGGGHNVAGYGTCDGGLVIDLSAMRDVRVDPENRVARAAGGATWGDWTARHSPLGSPCLEALCPRPGSPVLLSGAGKGGSAGRTA